MKIDKSHEILTLRETQNALLNLMHKLDAFLKKHDLKYSLAYGTALGAIRHQGFIPWDDDLDICMMREDYEKLIALLKVHKTDFDFFEFRNSKNYYYPFMKICDPNIPLKEPHAKRSMNLNIDVFPIDYVPDNENERKIIFKKIMHLRMLTAFKTNRIFYIPTRWKKSKKLVFLPVFFAANILMSLVSQKTLVKKYRRIFEKLNVKTNTIVDLTWGKLREAMNPSVMEELLFLKFEDGQFPIIKDYDFYLTLIYNDYMTLPKESERFTHGFKNYRKK